MYFSPSQDGARLPALPVPCQRAALFQARAEPKLDMLILFLTVAINPELSLDSALSNTSKRRSWKEVANIHCSIPSSPLPGLLLTRRQGNPDVATSLFLQPRVSVHA